MRRRTLGRVVLGILIGGVIGSALSFLLSGIFYPSPVKDFFFKVFKIGFSPFTLNLGFFSFTFGLYFYISVLTILFILLAIYILYKF